MLLDGLEETEEGDDALLEELTRLALHLTRAQVGQETLVCAHRRQHLAHACGCGWMGEGGYVSMGKDDWVWEMQRGKIWEWVV